MQEIIGFTPTRRLSADEKTELAESFRQKMEAKNNPTLVTYKTCIGCTVPIFSEQEFCSVDCMGRYHKSQIENRPTLSVYTSVLCGVLIITTLFLSYCSFYKPEKASAKAAITLPDPDLSLPNGKHLDPDQEFFSKPKTRISPKGK
jgi:predicted nucleic acid-binding Zn ribbon protein